MNTFSGFKNISLTVARSVNGTTEIGRIYAMTGLISALLPFISNPCYRFLFDMSADPFPQAILVMAGSIMAIAIVLNIILFMQRDKLES